MTLWTHEKAWEALQNERDELKKECEELKEELSLKGASLRDQFAMAATSGVWAHPDTSGNADDIARRAYETADAMMEARKEKTDEQ